MMFGWGSPMSYLSELRQPRNAPVFHGTPPKRKEKGTEIGGTTRNKNKKKELITNFLFFDFECMQETGFHVPTLVVVQDADGHEWVFKGALHVQGLLRLVVLWNHGRVCVHCPQLQRVRFVFHFEVPVRQQGSTRFNHERSPISGSLTVSTFSPCRCPSYPKRLD